ncbi:hypothetical protein O3885_05085 [Fusobacterium sp. 27098_8_59]|uniref:hypothetical protein n=1 Tax=Fusobacterium sp. 27098_8_59 TaxID=3003691 RepID=UPI00352DA08B
MMKVVTNKIKNSDEYSITRYSMSGIILKTIIFLILYSIYIYLGMYNLREISLSKIIKFIIGSLPFFIFIYLEAILGSSKEILFIKEDYLILKKYMLFFCFYSKVIKLEDIRKIYCEKDKGFLFFSTDLLKNIKFRVKENEFEDKIYAFGYKLSEGESTEIIEEIEEYIKVKSVEVEKENLMEKYNSPLDERYNYILNKILDEEKLFIFEKDNNFVINGDSEAIKDLEIFKDMNFEEIDFYVFYVNYLSKKEYENKEVLVGYNGVDGKEVTMSKFKEDINEIRDSRSIYGREVEK